MSMRVRYMLDVPEETAQVARAAFPNGNEYMTIRDEVGVIYSDGEFASLFSELGQPGVPPGLLAMATVLQYREGLTDRQAAEAVRARIDWKYLLGLPLTDPGVHYSVLSEFRDRLIAGGLEMSLLDSPLEKLVELMVSEAQQGASLMTTEDFIIELFCRIENVMRDVPKHSQAKLYPSEVVTLGFLFAIKSVNERAFYRWLKRDWRHLFLHWPERTRLFRLFKRYQQGTTCFLANPTVLGVADSYGIELLHPMREGRSHQQIGKKGSRITAGS